MRLSLLRAPAAARATSSTAGLRALPICTPMTRAAAPAAGAGDGAHTVALECVAPPLPEPVRLDQALLQLWPEHFTSLSRAKKSCRRGEVLVGGERAQTTRELQGGELVQWVQRSAGADMTTRRGPLPAGMPPIPVVFEDDHLACVCKPQNMPVDLAKAATPRTTLQQCLLHVLQPSAALGALWHPRYAHRLDEATGGLILVGKSWPAMRGLGEAFTGRQITKRYRALAWGRLEGAGLVRFSLDGRPCETEYAAVRHTRVRRCGGSGLCAAGGGGRGAAAAAADEGKGGSAGGAATAVGPNAGGSSGSNSSASSNSSSGGASRQCSCPEWVTTLDLWPHTGRTHQLRRHMALIMHPLVGDSKYTHGYAKQRRDAGLPLPPEEHVRLPPTPGHGSSSSGGGVAERNGATEVRQPQAGCAGEAGAAGAATAAGQTPPVPVHPPARPTTAGGEPERAGPALMGPAGAGAGAEGGGGALAATGWRSPVLCLWAVQLDLDHPVTGEQLHFELPEPQPVDEVRQALGGVSA